MVPVVPLMVMVAAITPSPGDMTLPELPPALVPPLGSSMLPASAVALVPPELFPI
jgi:hypothetical protein